MAEGRAVLSNNRAVRPSCQTSIYYRPPNRIRCQETDPLVIVIVARNGPGKLRGTTYCGGQPCPVIAIRPGEDEAGAVSLDTVVLLNVVDERTTAGRSLL